MIPSLRAQLRTELAAFYALGSPELKSSDALAGDLDDEPNGTASPTAIRKLAGQGLAELQRIAEHDERLNLTLNEKLRLADLADVASRRSAWARFCKTARRGH